MLRPRTTTRKTRKPNRIPVNLHHLLLTGPRCPVPFSAHTSTHSTFNSTRAREALRLLPQVRAPFHYFCFALSLKSIRSLSQSQKSTPPLPPLPKSLKARSIFRWRQEWPCSTDPAHTQVPSISNALCGNRSLLAQRAIRGGRGSARRKELTNILVPALLFLEPSTTFTVTTTPLMESCSTCLRLPRLRPNRFR